MVYSRGLPLIQSAGAQSKDVSGGSVRTENMHAGGHSPWICWECDPVTQWLSGKAPSKGL